MMVLSAKLTGALGRNVAPAGDCAAQLWGEVGGARLLPRFVQSIRLDVTTIEQLLKLVPGLLELLEHLITAPQTLVNVRCRRIQSHKQTLSVLGGGLTSQASWAASRRPAEPPSGSMDLSTKFGATCE